MLAACGTGLASGSLCEVAKVSVDTTAKDAVVARALGLAEAGQKALRVVLKRLVPGSAQAMLPAISDQDVEAMISSLSVRSEQNSTTRYLATFEAMQADYGFAPLVLAVAETEGGRFVTRLAGADSVGAINFGRSDALQGEDLQAAAQHAAAIALGIIENRWITQSREASQPVAAAYRTAVPESPRPSGIEVPRNVSAMVKFSGLKHWQEIRGRLAHVAGVQAIEVNSLSARAASITFDFAGPFDRLQAELNQNGFALEDRNGTFVLRSR
ncbi:MAG: hypothetical protein ABWY38_07545 [Methyloceanibacter sp.]